jgi:aspartyl-tRNA(Asn)/glutamyl-tRNA(Gln) amidotransferase subunit C
MPIVENQIMRLARLARLELSPSEHDRYTQELSQIIEYFDRISEVDTDQIELSAPMAALEGLREDVIRSSLPAEEALRNAPEKKDGFFIVPRVI